MLMPTRPIDSATSFFIVIFSFRKYIAKHTEAIGVIELTDVAKLMGICFVAYIHVKIAIILERLLTVCVLFGIKLLGICLR